MADTNAPPDRPAKNFDRQRHEWILRLAKDAHLTGTALRTGIVLAEEYMNRREGGAAWPSISTLKSELGAGERSVQEGIKQLVDRGHLQRENRAGKTPRYSMRDPRENPHPSPPRKSAPQRKSAPPQIYKGVNPLHTPADSRGKGCGNPHPNLLKNLGTEKDVVEPTSPSPSVRFAAAASSQVRQEEKTKASAMASKPRAGKRANPVQGDLIAQDAERAVVETLKAVQAIYPIGRRHPHDDAAWQKVGVELKKALRIASASEILDGMARYASSGENFDYIRDPRNWLKDRDWLKAWPPKRARADHFAVGPAEPAHYDSSRLEAEYGDAWDKPLGSL